MESLSINSQLRGFNLVDRISYVDGDGIRGEALFSRAPLYAGLEAMAQLGALHARRHIDFKRHLFLLKIESCCLPWQGPLQGRFRLSATMIGHSNQAFAYRENARGPDGIVLEAELLFGSIAYDREFNKEVLQRHYRELFGAIYEG